MVTAQQALQSFLSRQSESTKRVQELQSQIDERQARLEAERLNAQKGINSLEASRRTGKTTRQSAQKANQIQSSFEQQQANQEAFVNQAQAEADAENQALQEAYENYQAIQAREESLNASIESKFNQGKPLNAQEKEYLRSQGVNVDSKSSISYTGKPIGSPSIGGGFSSVTGAEVVVTPQGKIVSGINTSQVSNSQVDILGKIVTGGASLQTGGELLFIQENRAKLFGSPREIIRKKSILEDKDIVNSLINRREVNEPLSPSDQFAEDRIQALNRLASGGPANSIIAGLAGPPVLGILFAKRFYENPRETISSIQEAGSPFLGRKAFLEPEKARIERQSIISGAGSSAIANITFNPLRAGGSAVTDILIGAGIGSITSKVTGSTVVDIIGTSSRKQIKGIPGGPRGVVESRFEGEIQSLRFGKLGQKLDQILTSEKVFGLSPTNASKARVLLRKSEPIEVIETISIGPAKRLRGSGIPQTERFEQMVRIEDVLKRESIDPEFIADIRQVGGNKTTSIETVNSKGIPGRVRIKADVKPQAEVLKKQLEEGYITRSTGSINTLRSPVEFGQTSLQRTREITSVVNKIDTFFPGGVAEREVTVRSGKITTLSSKEGTKEGVRSVTKINIFPPKKSTVTDPLNRIIISSTEFEQVAKKVKVLSGPYEGFEKLNAVSKTKVTTPSGKTFSFTEKTRTVLKEKSQIFEERQIGQSKLDKEIGEKLREIKMKESTVKPFSKPVESFKESENISSKLGSKTVQKQLKKQVQEGKFVKNVTRQEIIPQTGLSRLTFAQIEELGVGVETIGITQTSPVLINRIRAIFGTQTSQSTSSQLSSIPVQFSQSRTKITPITTPVGKRITSPLTTPVRINSTVPKTSPVTTQKSSTTPVTTLITNPITAPVTIPVTTPITTPVNSPIVLPANILFAGTSFQPQSNKQKIPSRSTTGYDVLVKKRIHGKQQFVEIDSKSTSFSERDAIIFGQNAIDRGIEASFRIRESNSPIVELRGLDALDYKFRVSRRPGSKSVPVYVEIEGNRLDTKSEVMEITAAKIARGLTQRFVVKNNKKKRIRFGGMI